MASTPAESSFFRALALLKLYTGLHYYIYSELIPTSKNFEGEGLPKHILEKTSVFRKKGVKKWAFDGSLKISYILMCNICILNPSHL